ncbi:hypothetical protein AMAG_01497 [Allomyces macrogynus ATCC 38327]|uniref:Intraflagellar transport protein 122 homolog n=1 Tax=Allomyces macrogynus (strain ATCC 38327) TaxID=578462 RepID=A0A0L0RZ65_ALLM3|nr:hypothetical protein AMAG_01497 [Allomyces macrogynus ATCC 38327]|eukprot:KNE55608.1 hypothetical protein AMAG_01497 [Allomyces macrogynus ATCC 38327]
MRTTEVWADRLLDRDGAEQPVHAVAWTPDGTRLLAAVGPHLLVYAANDGRLLDTLRTHRDVIYAVAVSAAGAGLRAASGGADKTVIVWKVAAEPSTDAVATAKKGSKADNADGGPASLFTAFVKYTHTASVQALAFSPVSGAVCSATAVDFGLWNPETKAVTKFKVPAKLVCCAWSCDGQYLALGSVAGTVSIRNKVGEERAVIERGSDVPIWALQWNPGVIKPHASPNDASKRKDGGGGDVTLADALLVTDWNQTLAFYHASGKMLGRERTTTAEGDVLSVSHFHHGEFAVVAGTSGTISLWTSDGTRVGTLVDRPHSWLWSCSMSPINNMLAVATDNGLLAMHQVDFQTVHALHHDRYVYRAGVTDVIVQHFGLAQSCRIPFRDHVKKVAIYLDKVAVQLPSRIIIYEMVQDPTVVTAALAAVGVGGAAATILARDASPTKSQHPLEYRIRDRIPMAIDCNLMVMTGRHVLFCQDMCLEMYDFSGKHERQWKLDAPIRYIKVVGGPVGRELVLVGLRNGWTYQVFLDNPFPVPLVKQSSPVRCIDINRSRTKLAVIDDTETCFVYQLRHVGTVGDLLYQEPNATSVAWNSDHDDMLCFSGKNQITVKASTFPTLQQPHQGFVVGFKGTKLFSLHTYTMTVVDVPLATCLYQYLERRDWTRALQVAHLGAITDRDWEALGQEALVALRFDVAQMCFAHLKDYRMLTYIDMLQSSSAPGAASGNALARAAEPMSPSASANVPDAASSLLQADVFAIRGNFAAAADLYVAKDQGSRAVTMYTDLMMYEYALKLAKQLNLPTDAILKHKAELLRDKNDYEAAADTYLQVGDVTQAARLLMQHGAIERVMLLVQSYGDKMDPPLLAQCGQFFRTHKKWDQVAAVLKLAGDYPGLVAMLVQQDRFDDAFTVARERHLEHLVYLPYAQHLLVADDFAGAQKYFGLAGRMDLSIRLLRQLLDNSVAQERYGDAARHSFRLAHVHLQAIPTDVPRAQFTDVHVAHFESFKYYNAHADVLYAYDHVVRYVEEPFTSLAHLTLFNMARFLATRMQAGSSGSGSGVADADVDAWSPSLSRACVLFALVKLAHAVGAPKLALQVSEQLAQYRVPVAWHGTLDVLTLQARGKQLRAAKATADGKNGGMVGSAPATDAEDDLHPVCSACSATNPLVARDARCVSCREPFVSAFHAFDALPLIAFHVVGDPPVTEIDALLGTAKAFAADDDLMLQLVAVQGGANAVRPVVVDRGTVSRLPKAQVMAVQPPHACVPPLYYYSVLPDVMVTACRGCRRVFYAEDFEYLTVLHKGCPLCGTAPEGAGDEGKTAAS